MRKGILTRLPYAWGEGWANHFSEIFGRGSGVGAADSGPPRAPCEERTPSAGCGPRPPPGISAVRACPSGSEAEPPEGRESARRGGFAPRADGTDPTAAAVPGRTSKPLSINGESNPARFAPPACGLARSAPPPASQAPSVRAGVPPLRFLGKAVPRVVVEFAEPWKSVAEYAHRKEWSRVAVAVRTHFDPEYAKRTQK